MSGVLPLRTEADLDRALREIERFFDDPPVPGTPDGDGFDRLAASIEAYEKVHHPIEVRPRRGTSRVSFSKPGS